MHRYLKTRSHLNGVENALLVGNDSFFDGRDEASQGRHGTVTRSLSIAVESGDENGEKLVANGLQGSEQREIARDNVHSDEQNREMVVFDDDFGAEEIDEDRHEAVSMRIRAQIHVAAVAEIEKKRQHRLCVAPIRHGEPIDGRHRRE